MSAGHSNHQIFSLLVLGALVLLMVTGCASNRTLASQSNPMHSSPSLVEQMTQLVSHPLNSSPIVGMPSSSASAETNPASYIPDVTFTLKTTIAQGKLVFIGIGGSIDGVVNPTLQVNPNTVTQLTLINGDGAQHDISFPDFNATSQMVVGKGASSTIVFRADKSGEFPYFCTVPGHRTAGMEGKIVVGKAGATVLPASMSIARKPTDLPPPIGNRPPQAVSVNLETVEVEGQLADGVTYTYWTFDGRVPGPFIRVRVGDSVEVQLKNNTNSHMIHSIDLHAVIGPGGGAVGMQVPPGEEKAFTFKALHPGLYVYHCATPMVAEHIANGMYGLILVEPARGLREVDREFYVMQGEIYTQAPFRQHGHQEFSVQKLLAEQPEYFVFNGAVGALTSRYPLKARVGETVRIFFGVGGPNFTSSFHLIGEIFDRVYNLGSLITSPLQDVQTTLVPPGGAAVVEFKLEVPGRYILVDHALVRMERGLIGYLLAGGSNNPAVHRLDN